MFNSFQCLPDLSLLCDLNPTHSIQPNFRLAVSFLEKLSQNEAHGENQRGIKSKIYKYLSKHPRQSLPTWKLNLHFLPGEKRAWSLWNQQPAVLPHLKSLHIHIIHKNIHIYVYLHIDWSKLLFLLVTGAAWQPPWAHHDTNMRRELNSGERLLLDKFLLQGQDDYLHVTAPLAGGNTKFDADIRC